MVLEGRLRSINSQRQRRGELIFASTQQDHALVTIIHSREKLIQKGKLTLLQFFPKNYFAADVARSKCLHATSSNGPFPVHYIDDMNNCSLIMVMFPLGWEYVNIL